MSPRRLLSLILLAFVVASPAMAGPDGGGGATSAHLAAHYPLDEGSGTVACDASGHGLVGSFGPQPPAWVEGHVGRALQFGGQRYVRAANDPEVLESPHVTVDFRVRASGVSGFLYLLSKGAHTCQAASYAFDTSGGLAFYVLLEGGSYVYSPFAGSGLWNGDWHHVAGTFDGQRVRLFVDGVEQGLGTPTVTSSIRYGLPTHNDLYLGVYKGTCTSASFPGDLDNVRIWSTALDATIIAELAANPPDANPCCVPPTNCACGGDE